MEAQRRSSRSKRKPLLDCTNTLQNRPKTNPLSLKSKTLIKPPKIPFNNNNNNNNIFNDQLNPPICNSHTSTGSNNSPNSLIDGVGTDCRNPKVTADQIQSKETTRKDKGKAVAETPIIVLSASLTSKTLQVSSSSSPGHSSHSGTQAVQNQNVHVHKDKGKVTEDAPVEEFVQNQNVHVQRDKGKVTADAPVVESPAAFTSKYLQVSSSSGCSFSDTSPVHSHNVLEEKRKAKGKMVLEIPNIEASEPSTPYTPVLSFAASGTHDRPLTDYIQGRPRRGRKHAAEKINMPLSCASDQRSKKTGLELDSDRGVKKSGSHTDPLPVHKKKRSRNKYQMHVMPKEEVEKLKNYYADIDAFELPVEEVGSEQELE